MSAAAGCAFKITVRPYADEARAIEIQCPLCSFRRTFRTVDGAINRGAEHMRTVHRVRLVAP